MSPGGVRPTRATVNLQRLHANLRVIQKAVEVPVWGVVKADAYGHGAVQVSRCLEQAGVAGLCVSLLEEGIELREAGIVCPVLVMGGNYEGAYSELLQFDLLPVVTRLDQITACAHWVRHRQSPALPVHLKIDTGMARLGAAPQQWTALAESLANCRELQVTGLMTHLACAGEDAKSVDEQLQIFHGAGAGFARVGRRGLLRHAANTAGALAHPQSRLDAVRIGIGLYGYTPGVSNAPALQPVMRVSTEVVALRSLSPGGTVGYGATFRAERRTQLATVPLGYADGLSRSLSNRGYLLVRGRRAPIVGSVSMDMTTVNVTDIPGVQLGDEAVFLGEAAEPSACLGADTVARLSDTIAWEVLTSITRRVPRSYE